jgi:hypothetical protein
MGASGKKLQGHGQRRKATSPAASVRDGGWGNPPHPICARTGQKYWPLSGPRRRAFVVQSVSPDGAVCARRIDGKHERIKTTVERVIATCSSGEGRYYSFLAWMPRRYRTWAAVMEIAECYSTLVLPEWHPRRPISFPTRLLPSDARQPGAWLTLQADLSVAAGGQLNPSSLECCEEPGVTVCPGPLWEPAH